MVAPAPSRGVRSPLIRREERRRRALLYAIVAALLFSIMPVVGHHLLDAVPWLTSEQQHLVGLCLVALHLLLEPVHALAHALLYAGVVVAVLERGRAMWRHRRIMRALPTRPVEADTPLGRAAARAGLPLARVRSVEGLPMPAFATGWLSPTVIAAADLPARLDADELAAVMAHEAVHVRRRDPLRLFALRALSSLLFWLPALRRLAADLEDEIEITADDVVAETLALPLASAILALGRGDARVPATVGFQRADLLPRRIRRLAGEDAAAVSHVSTRSLMGAAAALLLTVSSGLMVLHPLHDAPAGMVAGPAHCDHPDEHPLRHLFCLGWRLGVGRGEASCPHEHVPHAGQMHRT